MAHEGCVQRQCFAAGSPLQFVLAVRLNHWSIRDRRNKPSEVSFDSLRGATLETFASRNERSERGASAEPARQHGLTAHARSKLLCRGSLEPQMHRLCRSRASDCVRQGDLPARSVPIDHERVSRASSLHYRGCAGARHARARLAEEGSTRRCRFESLGLNDCGLRLVPYNTAGQASSVTLAALLDKPRDYARSRDLQSHRFIKRLGASDRVRESSYPIN